MEITKQRTNDRLTLIVRGRLDGYWSDHLSEQLQGMIRDGADHLQLDLSGIDYISSAGLRVLLQFFKELQKIGGALSVVNPSDHVRDVLALSGLLDILASGRAPAVPSSAPAYHTSDDSGLCFQVFPVPGAAQLSCTIVGDPDRAMRGRCFVADCQALRLAPSSFGVGVGALGRDFDECRGRFGEFVAAAGAVVYQPTDGPNVPDYLVSTGSLVPELQILHGLVVEGRFAALIRFEARTVSGTVALTDLVRALLQELGCPVAGLVMVAETAGLIGAALRRSPASEQSGPLSFEFPAIREWLTLTSDHAFPDSQTLVAGVVGSGVDRRLQPMLRPLDGDELRGHLHGAAFSYRAIPKGPIDLPECVASLISHPWSSWISSLC